MQRRLFYLLLAMATLGIAACAVAAEPAVSQSQGAGNLKLLTWNIQMLPTALDFASEKLQKGQAMRAPWIIEHLNERDFDVVVLQEVLDAPITAKLKSGLQAKYPHIVSVDGKNGATGCLGGILFASRLPLKYVDHIVYQHLTGVDRLAEKGCVLVEGTVDGVPFQLAGTHLQAGDEKTRDQEFAEIRDGILARHRTDGVPQILAGDMNVDVKEPSYRLLLDTTEMTDGPLDDPHPFTTDGQNSWNPPSKRGKRIDHVLLNPRGTASRIVRQTVQRPRREHQGKTIDYADHYGVIAEIQLKP